MGWKAPTDDPFSLSPRLAVVERSEGRGERQRFLSQLGIGWLVVLVALAVGAVLLVAQLGP